MPLLTLGEAKTSRLRQVASSCPNGEEFLSLVNTATRQLMRRGNWFGTIQKLRACTYNRCVTWPRFVGTVEAINIGTQPLPVANNWYEFMPMDSSDYLWCCRSHSPALMNDGTAPVYRQIECGKNVYIRIYPTLQVDVGKTVRIFGIDSNGQTVRTKGDDGIWQDGEPIIVGSPFASTQRTYRQITRVMLPDMQGTSRLFQYDATNDVLLDCALYEAGETNPSYRHTTLSGMLNCIGCGDHPRSVTALVKLQFIPVKYDQDVILIENLDALELAIQAIKSGEGYSHEESEKAMLRAVREMNLELRDRFPLDQIPIDIAPFGTAVPAHAGIGRVL